MEFPEINDANIKEAKLELCNPKKETIAILKEAYNINVSIKAMQINTLEFCLPLKMDMWGELVANPHLPDMRPYYLIRLTIGDYKEYFRITKPKDEGGNETYKSYYCLSYISTLADRQLVSYSATSLLIGEVLTDVLRGTNWKIKKTILGTMPDIDSEFNNRYRAVESGSTNVLSFIFDNLVNAYNCLPIFDTETNEISIRAPGNVGKDTGLTLSYRKYIDTFGLELNTDEFTTRLQVRGKDGLSIHEVTPTGQPYLENFSYFMYGYEEGVSSSPYWSDGLCAAQIEYENLLASKEGQFEGYLNNKRSKNDEIKAKEVELETLLQSLHQTQEIVTILMGMPEQYYYHDLNYTGTSISETTKLNKDFNYVCMGMTTSTSGLTLKIDGSTVAMQSNTWKVLSRLVDRSSCKIDLSGSGNANVIIVIAKIYEAEIAETDTYLLDKYCEVKWVYACEGKIAEIEVLQDEIATIDSNINSLRVTLGAETNFPPELLEERNEYIIEKTYENHNITDPKDLLETAMDYFEEVNSPTLVLELSLVNFLDLATDDTGKLFYSFINDNNDTVLSTGLYDKIKVRYEPFDVDVECMIMEINLDVENSHLDFTLSNVHKVLTDDEKLKEMIGKTSSTTAGILQEKYKWDDATEKTNLIRDILEGVWDAAAREIKAGVNEDVEVDRRGITVTDPTNPQNVVRVVSGWIGLSQDGGKSFRTAINARGVYASALVGEILAGENLILTNEAGTFEVTRDGVRISGMSLTIGGGLPDNQIASADDWNAKETPSGAQQKADDAEQAAKDYAEGRIPYKVDIFSTGGLVFKNGVISTTLIARVYRGKDDITDLIDANHFRWTRVSDDPAGDAVWNDANYGGSKQIVVTQDDVFARATFVCEILKFENLEDAS